jgi:hypothetical protein
MQLPGKTLPWQWAHKVGPNKPNGRLFLDGLSKPCLLASGEAGSKN